MWQTLEEGVKRNAKRWMESTVVTCTDQSDMDKRKLILCLMKTLAQTDFSCLEEVAAASPKSLKKCKVKELEPFVQMVMMEAANLTYRQQHQMQKHLIQAGCNVLLPSECVVKQC